MPVANIYLFADRLSAKLYHLDTRAHATAYAANEPDNFISADDFLYARCAVVAEGKAYYEKVLNDPAQMPDNIVFEPLLYLADDAFEMKMGIPSIICRLIIMKPKAIKRAGNWHKAYGT